MCLYFSLAITVSKPTAIDLFLIEVRNILFIRLEIPLIFAFDDTDITNLLSRFGMMLLIFLSFC